MVKNLKSKKYLIEWLIILVLLMISFLTFLFNPPIGNKGTFNMISYFFQPYTVIIHVIFLTVIILGLIFSKVIDELYSGFILFIIATCFLISLLFYLFHYFIFFIIIFILILVAYANKQLRWNFRNLSRISALFGFMGLFFGFWYLNWVYEPIFINALIFSSVGLLINPTLLTICGFLCMSIEPRSIKLEFTVAIITLLIGFISIFLYYLYFDIFLIIVASFLIIRLLILEIVFKDKRNHLKYKL
jgi:hypothetical protein